MKTNLSFLKIMGLLAIACTLALTTQAQVARIVADMERYERYAGKKLNLNASTLFIQASKS